MKTVIQVMPVVKPLDFDGPTGYGRENIGAIMLKRAGDKRELSRKDIDFLKGVEAAGVWGANKVIALIQMHDTVSITQVEIGEK